MEKNEQYRYNVSIGVITDGRLNITNIKNNKYNKIDANRTFFYLQNIQY